MKVLWIFEKSHCSSLPIYLPMPSIEVNTGYIALGSLRRTYIHHWDTIRFNFSHKSLQDNNKFVTRSFHADLFPVTRFNRLNRTAGGEFAKP